MSMLSEGPSGVFKNFVYENFTGDMDHPDYWKNHPSDQKRALVSKMNDAHSDPVDAAEGGLTESMLAGQDPDDPRWKKMRELSQDYRKIPVRARNDFETEEEWEAHNQAKDADIDQADKKAYAKAFG
jgi:hypothetical protein